MRKEPTTRNILISFDISSIAGRDQLAGVLRYLRSKPNWVPRLLSRAADFTPEVVRNAHNEHIDGIIINHAGSPETEDALATSDIPLAVIGIRNPKLVARTRAIALIRNDNVETGRIAARHFLSLGNFRSYGYIPAAQSADEWSLSRETGFREVLENNGVDALTFPQTANAGTEEARKALADWLKSLTKPAAVLAAWDYPGVQALEICRAEKIKVPHDIAILGVDNDPMVCDATTPPLSSIPFDYEKEGYESAAALNVLLEKPARRAKPVMVACHPLPVFVRESAARIAPASGLIKQALRYITKNAVKGISSRDVAEALGISQSLLTLRFREYANTTVMDALIDARLKKTCELLVSTNRSIQEVTTASGFRNANYLKAVFKEKFGLSMREYRAAKRPSSAVSGPANARSGKGRQAPKKRRRTRRDGSAK